MTIMFADLEQDVFIGAGHGRHLLLHIPGEMESRKYVRIESATERDKYATLVHKLFSRIFLRTKSGKAATHRSYAYYEI